MKTSTQLKAMIKNLSHSNNIDAQILLRNYMFERLLERISLSKYQDRIILKGGMLIAAMVGIDYRSTMDMDTTIKGEVLTKEIVKKIFEDIFVLNIDDNVKMALKLIEEIRDEDDYIGFRILIETVLDKTKQILKIDITTGDFITPKEITYNFNLMFEDRTIKIKAYNLETILAEKLETIIIRSIANTRMRDFYDVFILATTQKNNIDILVLKEAFKKTSIRRGTDKITLEKGKEILKLVSVDKIMQKHWERYKNKYSYANAIEWEQTINSISELIHQII